MSQKKEQKELATIMNEETKEYNEEGKNKSQIAKSKQE